MNAACGVAQDKLLVRSSKAIRHYLAMHQPEYGRYRLWWLRSAYYGLHGDGPGRKTAELAGDIERTHERLRELVNQLEHIDGTLRIVSPDMTVEAIRPKAFRPSDDSSKRGQISRLVLSILRQSNEPPTSREIAAQMLLERAMDAEGVKMLRTLTKRVGAALREQRDKGRVASEDGPGTY